MAFIAAMLLVPATANATLTLVGDASSVRGQIGLTVYGSKAFDEITGGEIVDDEYVPLTTFKPVDLGTHPQFGEIVVGDEPRVAPWTCTQERVFMAVGTYPDGTSETASFIARTPSCKNRLRVEVPTRVRPGRHVTTIIRDSFEAGGIDMRLCHGVVKKKQACETLSMPEGVTAISSRFDVPRKGRYAVALGYGPQRIKRVVSVGLAPRPEDLATLPGIITTGDSMMQTLDTVLDDRLEGRASLISDVFIGAGFTKPFIVDWTTLPSKQVRKNRPDATIVFLGANESGPLNPPSEPPIQCCSEAWIAEYERRARAMMKTYVRSGEGAVIWLNNPVPRSENRAGSMAAVNVAIERAAKGIDRARVLDMAALFTPGGQYRESMPYDGKTIRVRQDDGIHLSTPGARIAAVQVLRELTKLGVL